MTEQLVDHGRVAHTRRLPHGEAKLTGNVGDRTRRRLAAIAGSIGLCHHHGEVIAARHAGAQ
jgi:hypothetical protein